MLRRSSGHDVAAADVPQRRLERALDNQLDADRRSEMQADVYVAHAVCDDLLVADRALDEANSIVAEGVVEILQAASAQIVQNHDFVAAFTQHIYQVRADESGPTRDEVFHGSS